MAEIQKTQERFSAEAKGVTFALLHFQTLQVFEKWRHIQPPWMAGMPILHGAKIGPVPRNL